MQKKLRTVASHLFDNFGHFVLISSLMHSEALSKEIFQIINNLLSVGNLHLRVSSDFHLDNATIVKDPLVVEGCRDV